MILHEKKDTRMIVIIFTYWVFLSLSLATVIFLYYRSFSCKFLCFKINFILYLFFIYLIFLLTRSWIRLKFSNRRFKYEKYSCKPWCANQSFSIKCQSCVLYNMTLNFLNIKLDGSYRNKLIWPLRVLLWDILLHQIEFILNSILILG